MAVGLFIVCVACGERTLDGASAQAQILAQLRQAGDRPIESVTCPDDVVVQEGSTFTCIAVEPGGTRWTIEVTQVDDAGTLDYRITSEPAT
jgi:hypothetical protein